MEVVGRLEPHAEEPVAAMAVGTGGAVIALAGAHRVHVWEAELTLQHPASLQEKGAWVVAGVIDTSEAEVAAMAWLDTGGGAQLLAVRRGWGDAALRKYWRAKGLLLGLGRNRSAILLE